MSALLSAPIAAGTERSSERRGSRRNFGKISVFLKAFFPLALAVAGLSGCPKSIPLKEMEDSTQSIERAEKGLAARCAKEELEAAKKMLAKAKSLMDMGDYEEAKKAFVAAKELAVKAEEAAQLRKEECLEKERNKNRPVKPPPAPPPVVVSRDTPTTDTRQMLETIYFDFNQYTLSERAKRILLRHAEWLKKHPDVKIEISGHCDQRGSVEYNLALGERRALAAKKFLVALGISPDRIKTISYGHQRLADPRYTEEAFAKNRRAEFRIIRK